MNHEAWAIPYADLMTLLLAFFVVMYAVSVVNEGKFRVMSKSINEAFNGTSHVIAPLGPTNMPPHSLAPPMTRSGTLGNVIVAPITAPIAMIHPPTLTTQAVTPGHPGQARSVAPNAPSSLDHIESMVRHALQPLVDKKWVTVRRQQDWLEIEIRTDILFPSGVAQLSASSDQVLQNLTTILAPFANPLRVEGFTDNVPISTALYPSNWELSAARAASVARLFASGGVDPARMGIVGWGDVRPLADNSTLDGRNRNRRVLVVVMSDSPAAPRVQSAADSVATEPGLSVAAQAPALPTRYVVGHPPPNNVAALVDANATDPAVPRAVVAPAALPAAPTITLWSGAVSSNPPAAALPTAVPDIGLTTPATATAPSAARVPPTR